MHQALSPDQSLEPPEAGEVESDDTELPGPSLATVRQLSALHTIAVRLPSARTRAAAADVIVPTCIRALGAAGGLLAVAMPSEAALALEGPDGVPPTVLAALQQSTPPERSPLVDVLQDGKPLWLSRLEIAARYPHLASSLVHGDVESWAVVPLFLDEHVLGALALAFGSTSKLVRPEAQTFLLTVAAQAAAALARLQQADALERQTSRLEALAEAPQAFAQAGQDLDEVLGLVVRRISELLGGACAIRLVEPDGYHLRLAALYHPDAELAAGARTLLTATPQRVDEGLAVAVLARGEPVLIPSVDPVALRASVRPVFHPHLERWPISSMLTVPLRTRAGPFGMLSMTRYAGEAPYTDEDQTFLLNLADRAALAIANAQLYTRTTQAQALAERAAAHTLRLQRLTASLAEALTPGEVMEIVAAQVHQLIGVASGVIGLVSSDGLALELVQMVGYAPGDMRPWQRMPLDSSQPGTDVVKSGQAQFWETRAALLSRYPQLAQAVVRSEAWAIVPLRSEGRTLGMLSLGFPEPRSFDAEDRSLLELLAGQCAAAVQRTARFQAIERATEHTTRLYEVTAALAEALTISDVADVILTQGIAALGAVAGSVRQLSPDGTTLVALNVVGYPPEMTAQWHTIPLDALVPMAEVARTARPLLIESPAELAASYPRFREAMEALQYQAIALLPLIVAGRAIGTISFGFAAPRTFDADDRGFLEALAHQSAVALERARLYEATQQQAARLGALAEASHLFAAASLDLPNVLEAIATRVAHAIGDLGAVGLLSDDRQFLLPAAIAHPNPEAREVMKQLLSSFPLGVDEGISSHTLRTGQAQLLPVIPPEQLRVLIKPDHWPYLDRFGIYSLMVAPLRVNGEVIGTLGAVRDSPGRPYTESDLTMLQELADRAALAVANARLYQQAREAIQIRDQFLSIAAHELKTPLTALSGQVQLVQRRLARGEQTAERLARSIDILASQADRLDAMVHTLLDVGRIERGQFVLERRPVDLVHLIGHLVDELRPDLDQHTLLFEYDPDSLWVEGDALRLEQLIQNLLSNAVKYSPAGGTITVRVERQGVNAHITVADQGLGIPTAALPQLFQRFYRAENVAAHHISGMGIGLYVVREIVTRHDGTVDVASIEGAGSTFTVRLPTMRDDVAGGV